MATVRVALGGPGRLVRVSLDRVPLHDRYCRLWYASRLREDRWNHDLRPDTGYSPEMALRIDCLDEAVELVRAAIYPKREHLLPETVVDEMIAKGRYEPEG